MGKNLLIKSIRSGIGVFLVIVVLLGLNVIARAEGFYENSFISYSPDNKAWTVQEALPRKDDAVNKKNPTCWYPYGEVVETGRIGTVLEVACGEHFYKYERHGMVPIQKWVVTQHAGKCIHNDATSFHGVPVIKSHCESSYYSGWNCYCADCGEKVVNFYFYMSREKVSKITELDLELGYYYLCPTCGHMEQGAEVRHACKAVSANRYRVKYMPNGGNVAGFMQSSFHMYGNARLFEGEPVTPIKNLNLNSYTRPGYVFLGWNSMADGSGESFEDGQEIYNLTEENYDPLEDKGTVVLYAQWKKVTGKLEIDPAGGTYQGHREAVSVDVGYEESYKITSSDIVPPSGFLIKFEVNGGDKLEDVRDARILNGWKLMAPAKGTLEGECYRFLGADGEKDVVKALYRSEGIILPLPTRKGYAFGGWYFDEGFSRQAGKAGDLFMAESDKVLYACWVDLVLEATVNLTAHKGRGAVDLNWEQPDDNPKMYLIYQKREGDEFRKIYDATEEEEDSEKFEFEGRAEEDSFIVEKTGFYKITASGAKGQDFDDNKGGLGGVAEGVFFLSAGDEIQIVFDDGKEENGGISEKYGDGGGSASVISKELGTLLVAGGGGGALPGADGGAGGTEEGLREDGKPEGEDGAAGGGAGKIGGKSGIYEKHVHTEKCIHVHSGDLISGGDCYKEVEETKTCHVIVSGPNIDWKKNDNCDHCIKAGRNGYGTMHPRVWKIEHHGCGKPDDNGTAGWWVCDSCGEMGYKWGSGTESPKVSDHTWKHTEYVLNCTKEYDCGDPPGKSVKSHGGSNYINKEAAISYSSLKGKNDGDCSVVMEIANAGFLEKTELMGAYAPDMDCPDKVDDKSVCVDMLGNRDAMVTFAKPLDRGTVYYHQVHSYLAGKEEILSRSNITATEVLTGISGYYYLVDKEKGTQIAIVDGRTDATFCAGEEIMLFSLEEGMHLHLAALDRAGNLGKSIDIELNLTLQQNLYRPSTEKMIISSVIEGMEYGSVAEAEEEGKYYVRANGRTPFLLTFSGTLSGAARDDYQVDRLTYEFSMRDAPVKGSYTSIVPKGKVSELECLYGGEHMGRLTVGSGLLQAGMYGMAQRKENMKTVVSSQSFCLEACYDGKVIRVIPIAGATLDGRILLSNRRNDEKNGLYLIGDGEAPRISGIPESEALLLADREEEVMLDLFAEDLGSGMMRFEAELRNLDNGNEAFYHPDADGHIRICMEMDNPLFEGDLQLWLRATDKVGNSREVCCGAQDFGLRAEIIRVLQPHDPIFKRGESGILRIKARGYVRKLEIEFPGEFVEWDSGIKREFEYAEPQAQVVEEVLFMVPLEMEKDGVYEVVVKAYKGEEMLEDRPELCTFMIEDSVLRELRTRLR